MSELYVQVVVIKTERRTDKAPPPKKKQTVKYQFDAEAELRVTARWQQEKTIKIMTLRHDS